MELASLRSPVPQPPIGYPYPYTLYPTPLRPYTLYPTPLHPYTPACTLHPSTPDQLHPSCSQMGQVFKYLVPVHAGAVGVHALKGQNLLPRIVPGMAK